jgi:hypothetical protein
LPNFRSASGLPNKTQPAEESAEASGGMDKLKSVLDVSN